MIENKFTPEDILINCDKYIEEKGEYTVTKKVFDHEERKEKVITETSIALCSLAGLAEYMDICENSFAPANIKKQKAKDTVPDYTKAIARARQKLKVHNERFHSMGKINTRGFLLWSANCLGELEKPKDDLDIKEQKENIKKKKMENKVLSRVVGGKEKTMDLSNDELIKLATATLNGEK